jgi:MYXO-CTERM domain-containing protein
MLAYRIAFAGAIAVLAAPATAFAANADGATPTATPLIVELAVAALVVGGLVARRRVAALARAVAHRVVQHRPQRQPRVSER